MLDRQSERLGPGPRIAPMQTGELTQEAMEVRAELRQIAGRDVPNPTLADTPEIVATMLRHPRLFRATIQLGLQLQGASALPARDRELMVLRLAWLCQAPYEFGEHVLIARREGIGRTEVERIIAGSEAPGWSDYERALLRAVEELRADATITDATWSVLARHLNEQQLIELPILVGHYQMAAYYQNALRLRLHAGNHGLAAR